MVSTTLSLPVEKIIVDEPNRLKRDIEEDCVLLDFKNNIEQYGIKVPLLVTNCENGSYHLVDGHRRLQVAVILKYKEILCTLVDSDKSSEISLSVNIHREDLTLVEIGKILQNIYAKKLEENPDFKYSELSPLINKSKSFISQHIGYISKLSKDIQDDIITHKRMIDKNIISRIFKLDEDEQMDVYKQVVDKKLSREAVAKLIKELKKEDKVSTDTSPSNVNIEIEHPSENHTTSFHPYELTTVVSTNILELKIDTRVVTNIKEFEIDFEMLIQKYNLVEEV